MERGIRQGRSESMDLLAWRQFWNLKDQLRSRDTAMKSRLALLHLAVTPVLFWAADLDTLCETAQGSQIRVRHHGATHGKETTKGRGNDGT